MSPGESYSAEFGSSALHADTGGDASDQYDSLPDESDDVLADLASKLWLRMGAFGEGLQESWKRLVGKDPAGSFVADYADYVRASPEFERDRPERHAFMRDHVFFGASFAPYIHSRGAVVGFDPRPDRVRDQDYL